MQRASFLLKLVEEKGGVIRFIRAVEEGCPCWFYLRLDPNRWADYQKRVKEGNLDIRDYGRILESGWGDYPDEDVMRFMKDEYGFETPVRAEQQT